MLSRLVMSQVKHNSYFLVGLAIGLCVALVAVPLEEGGECAAAGAAAEGGGGAVDEFAAAHASRPGGGGGGGARSVQRPRYYTTELGMRAPLLAAVLTSEEQLAEGGRGWALNATLGALAPALRFFVSATAPGAAPRANVVAFTDTREMLKPFHVLKYLADNHLEEYDFFFLVSDGSLVNARRLAALVRALSSSQLVYMGARADDDSHYCTLEGGILLSSGVLRAVHGALEWCVRNSYSARHHENIGRCVLHAAHTPCAHSMHAHKYTSLADDGGAGAAGAELAEAVTLRGVGSWQRLLALHALVSRERLQRGAAARRAAAAAMRRAAARAPPGYRNTSWPRGLRDDGGLAPPAPENRWDHLRWTAFNATHALMPDDHRAAAPLAPAHLKALQVVVNASVAWARRAWGAEGAELVEGAWRWEPARALRYQLTLRLPGGALRRVEAARALGAARLVAVPYVTESSRVWLVLPLPARAAGPALAALRRYQAAALQRRANTALVAVILTAEGAEAGRQEITDAVHTLKAQHRDATIELTEAAEGAAAGEAGAGAGEAAREARAARAALDAALRHTPRDALLLLGDAYTDYNDDFLNRVRMNTIAGAQWFLPVEFSHYAAWQHPRLLATATGARPGTGTGRFNPKHARLLAVYRQDYEAARSQAEPDGGSGVSVAELLAASKLRCIQAPEPGLVSAARGAPCGLSAPSAPSAPGAESAQSVRACLRAERAAHFQRLDLGARHTLARLLLEAAADTR